MDKKFAIFDMDGTLVDSSSYWGALSAEYLRRKGVKDLPEDLMERAKPLTMPETAELFVREFGLAETPEAVSDEMNAMMEAHYRSDIPLKAGAAGYLAKLRARGVRMCVASATAAHLIAACLERLGVLDDFDFILSCEEVDAGKTRPDVYLAAARRLGAAPGEIAVFEDAVYAVRTARAAGFYTVAVYDADGVPQWDEMTALAHETILDWSAAE